MTSLPTFRVGVDGGGSGTRARLQSADGLTLGHGQAGPAALGQGVDRAWRHVRQAIAAAFEAATFPLPPPRQIALGLGLAGAGVAAQRAAFLAADPGYRLCRLDTDATTQLLGAHAGGAGIVVAAGTGSVAAARFADGMQARAGGWGFPIGDEGGGAWLGWRAVQAAQAAIDGRAAGGPLCDTVRAVIGADRATVLAWCAAADAQAHAQFAPAVFAAAAAGDAVAAGLLQAAADELARLVTAVQRDHADLPVALVGGIGRRLLARWPAALRARVVEPAGDSADGALRLLPAVQPA